MKHVSTIETPQGNHPVFYEGISYSVPSIRFTTKRGQVRGCRGCKDEREAFIVAKRLAKAAGKDVSAWKLKYLPL